MASGKGLPAPCPITADCQAPVSYTHLDVYKRQVIDSSAAAANQNRRRQIQALIRIAWCTGAAGRVAVGQGRWRHQRATRAATNDDRLWANRVFELSLIHI